MKKVILATLTALALIGCSDTTVVVEQPTETINDFNITQDLKDNVFSTFEYTLSGTGGELCTNTDAWLTEERKNYVALTHVVDGIEGRLENRVMNVFQDEISTGRFCFAVLPNMTDSNLSHSMNIRYFYEWDSERVIAKVEMPTVIQPVFESTTIIENIVNIAYEDINVTIEQNTTI